jgi:hypothetical protein
MNVINRIRKLETRRKPRTSQTAWNFEKTTNEQLLRLESLFTTGEASEAARFTQQLIEDGFLSYQVIEV